MEIRVALPYDKDWRKRNVSSLSEIILHHAEWYECTIEDIERDHAKKWSGGFGYNYFVDKEGVIFEGRPVDVQTAANHDHNLTAVSICAEGNFHPSEKQKVDTEMNPKQFNAIVDLCRYLKKLYPQIIDIFGHIEVNDTECPGEYFPLVQIKKEVSKIEMQHTTIRQGDKGDLVRELQFMLNYFHFKCSIDGAFGAQTKSQVIKFQNLYCLDADGIVGKNTWNALLNPKYFIIKHNNYITYIKIRKDKINKIDVVLGNQPKETLNSMYKRSNPKPDFMLNGGLFAMNNGNSMSTMYDEGKQIASGYFSTYGMYIMQDGSFGFDYLEKRVDGIRDFMGASPSLIIDGKQRVDARGLDYAFIYNKHPRTCIGQDKDYLYVVIVDGRKLLKPGMKIEQLVQLGLDLKLTHMINLDGGGSTKLINKKGESINAPLENRAIDNGIAIYLK